MKKVNACTFSVAFFGTVCILGPVTAQVPAGVVARADGTLPTAHDNEIRRRFVASAEADIAKGKVRIVEFEQRAGAASVHARGGIDRQLGELRSDVRLAEARLTEMKQATDERQEQFEAGVTEAIARIRKWLSTAPG